MKQKEGSKIWLGLFLGAVSLAAYWLHIHEKRKVVETLNRRSELAKADRGIMEYAQVGTGPAMLVSHGTLGGFDQSIGISRLFTGLNTRFIAASRAGYLRSSLESGVTPEMQADNFALLLDHLSISRAAIIGLSGGAPSALQFALRHPDRCWGLILISSISQRPPPLPRLFQIVVDLQDGFMRFDFIWWLLLKFGLRPMLMMNGLNASQTSDLLTDPVKSEVCKAIFQPAATASLRRVGVKNDGDQLNQLPGYPLESIVVPSLIIHSPSDKLASFQVAQAAAKRIPQAKLLKLEDGGHLSFVVHRERVAAAVSDFVNQCSPRTKDN